MITIYKIIDFKGFNHGTYSTDVSLIERKEQIINKFITKSHVTGNYQFKQLLEFYQEKGEEFINLVLLQELNSIDDEDLKIMIKAYNKRANIDNFNLKESLEVENVKGKRLRFRENWKKYSRPTIITDNNNEILNTLSKDLKVDIGEVEDIIKYYSLFTIENMKQNKSTRIPIIGSFKTKKKIRRSELDRELVKEFDLKKDKKYEAIQKQMLEDIDFEDYICN